MLFNKSEQFTWFNNYGITYSMKFSPLIYYSSISINEIAAILMSFKYMVSILFHFFWFAIPS